MGSRRKTVMYLSLIGGFVLFCTFYNPLTKADTAVAEQNKISDSRTTISVITSPPAVIRRADKLYQPIQVEVLHFGKELEAEISITGAEPVKLRLQPGRNAAELFVPPIKKNELKVTVDLEVAGKCLSSRKLLLKRVRNWNVYLLHHSHVDIGYTHLQTEVESNQWKFFEQAIELARKTADYPAGSRFKWNAEVLWAVDSYLKQASVPKRQEFIDAVRKGWIGLDALYGNELTALCRPEELVRLVDYAQRLRQRYNLKIDTAMITDVPGYTWGIVPVLAQSGVKYFSIGPNDRHRIGYVLSAWGDKPFYWDSPSGKHNVLCWVAGKGYVFFFRGRIGGGKLFEYLKRLEDSKYPYNMVQLRYSIDSDNGPPDPELSDFVRSWNTIYAYPKLIIATTSEMFREFERQYGKNVPKVQGDFTPYW
ncbi:MAG: glycoside hydrolase family 38 N-terminal domain-containing protein, partial [Planctomycetota bacterium]